MAGLDELARHAPFEVLVYLQTAVRKPDVELVLDPGESYAVVRGTRIAPPPHPEPVYEGYGPRGRELVVDLENEPGTFRYYGETLQDLNEYTAAFVVGPRSSLREAGLIEKALALPRTKSWRFYDPALVRNRVAYALTHGTTWTGESVDDDQFRDAALAYRRIRESRRKKGTW